MAKSVQTLETREQIMQAALKRFAHGGYAATSVQQIVDDARVSKPSLYYYFEDKAALYQALVSEALDARYNLMVEAARGPGELRVRLVKILGALFDYFNDNRELMRLSFATMFSSPGELPEELRYIEKGQRNFEVIHSVMKEAMKNGEVSAHFDARELALGFHGHINTYIMANLLLPGHQLNRAMAGRIVELFLAGAGVKK
jgi:TetR/AcrR family transcriptional repressor of mexJK operon